MSDIPDLVQSATSMFEAVGVIQEQTSASYCEDFILGLNCVSSDLSPHALSCDQRQLLIDQIKHAPWKAVFVAADNRSPWVPQQDSPLRAVGCVWPSASQSGRYDAAVWDWKLMQPEEQRAVATACQTETVFVHRGDTILHALTAHSGPLTLPSCVIDSWNIMRLSASERRRMQRKADVLDAARITRLKDDDWGYTLEDLLHYTGMTSVTVQEHISGMAKKIDKEEALSIPLKREILRRAMYPMIVLHRHFMADLPDPEAFLSLHIRQACETAFPLIGVIEQKCPFYMETMEPSYRILADMTYTGIPWDWRSAHALETVAHQQLVDTVNGIHDQPDLSALLPYERALKNYRQSITDDMHAIWSDLLKKESGGRDLPVNFSGKKTLSIPKLKASGFHEGGSAVVFEVLDRIQSVKTEIEFFSRMRRWAMISLSDADRKGVTPREILNQTENNEPGRIHALLIFGPETDRLAACDPNIQAMPKRVEIRRLVKARKGKRIVAVDYSQMDLRVAAALGLRVQHEIWTLIQEQGPQCGIIWNLSRMDDAQDLLDAEKDLLVVARERDEDVRGFLDIFSGKTERKKYQPDLSEKYHQAWMAQTIAWRNVFWARVRLLQIQQNKPVAGRLAQVFMERLDAHMVTGLHMSMGGAVDDVFSLLRQARDEGRTAALQQKYAAERKNAKPVNFGLLYGIAAEHLHEQGVAEYNLDWSVQDAANSSEAWFSLYPEIGLLRYHTMCSPILSEKTVVPDTHGKWNGISGFKEKFTHTWRVSSLDGRSYERNSWKEALNYQDQGTGAHIVLRAMNMMTPLSRQYLINQVHDELVAEAPDTDADYVLKDMSRAMIAAGEAILKPYGIPVEVEGGIGDTWWDC